MRVFSKFPERITRISGIPTNQQRFKTITVNQRIRFLDSYQFLSDPLAKLVDTLRKSNSTFPLLSSMLTDDESKSLSAEQEETKTMLLRKGAYPYSFATSLEALQEAKSLPAKSHFDNDMTLEPCPDEDYAFAQKVWDHFECDNMLDYTVLYMNTDVFLLADVVFNFRDVIYDNFEIDMCQYLSLPHLAMDCMLKKTGVEIEMLSDQDMADWLRKGIRGGHSFVNLRRAVKTPNMTLKYVDMTNLYGKAMMQPLPVGDYKFLEGEELANFNVRGMRDDDDYGCILEVDLEYPEMLHQSHSSFPLAPENIEITTEDLSPYSRRCMETLSHKKQHRAKKLTATMRDKKNYVIHGSVLRLYLSLGLKLIKIHRVLTFRQRAFIRPFIEECARNRMLAATEVEQAMWKLMANSVYGKFIESVEKRMDCRFNRTREASVQHCSSPLYKGQMICDEDLSITFLRKKSVQMRQCWAVGFSILDISKGLMYDLYYNGIKPAFRYGCVRVIMSDTDSFLLQLKDTDELDALVRLRDRMDFSNLPPEHPLYSRERAKVPGYLKDEMPGDVITKVIALRSKCYAIQTAEGELKTTSKGVTKAGKKSLTIESFERCIDQIASQEVTQNTITSKNHINKMMRSTRVAFSSFDDKRHQTCAIHSAPLGSIQVGSYKCTKTCFECQMADRYIF